MVPWWFNFDPHPFRGASRVPVSLVGFPEFMRSTAVQTRSSRLGSSAWDGGDSTSHGFGLAYAITSVSPETGYVANYSEPALDTTRVPKEY